MDSDRLLELARECARKVIENEIQAIKDAEAPTMHVFWDLCSDALALVESDDDARDRLWDAVCEELEAVEITYAFEGETAREQRRIRLEEEMTDLGLQIAAAEMRRDALQQQLRRIEEDDDE